MGKADRLKMLLTELTTCASDLYHQCTEETSLLRS
jgi:hypothetical protein